MKTQKCIIGLLALCLLPQVSLAKEEGQLYGALSLLAVWNDDADLDLNGVKVADIDYDAGFGISGAIGYDWGNVRTELELVSRSNDMDITAGAVTLGGDIDSLALMGNLYYDQHNSSDFTPYIGVGLGAVDVDGFDTVFAYQAMGGVTYTIDKQNEVFVGYRYFGAETVDDTQVAGGVEFDYESHNAEIGYRIRF